MKVELKTLYYLEEDGIASIVINMPPANKMTPQYLDEVVTVIMNYAVSTKMQGIIVRGEGRHYSSGADIELLLNMIRANCTRTEDGQILPPERNIDVKKAFHELYQCNIPVVSVIQGFCIGSGFELALQTHIRIAERGARVGFPETSFKLLPGINGTIRCIQEIGYKRAMEFIIKGELIGCEDAYTDLLVDYIAEKRCGENLAKDFIHYVNSENVGYSNKNARRYFWEFLKVKTK